MAKKMTVTATDLLSLSSLEAHPALTELYEQRRALEAKISQGQDEARYLEAQAGKAVVQATELAFYNATGRGDGGVSSHIASDGVSIHSQAEKYEIRRLVLLKEIVGWREEMAALEYQIETVSRAVKEQVKRELSEATLGHVQAILDLSEALQHEESALNELTGLSIRLLRQRGVDSSALTGAPRVAQRVQACHAVLARLQKEVSPVVASIA